MVSNGKENKITKYGNPSLTELLTNVLGDIIELLLSHPFLSSEATRILK